MLVVLSRCENVCCRAWYVCARYPFYSGLMVLTVGEGWGLKQSDRCTMVDTKGGNVSIALFFLNNKLLTECDSFLLLWRLVVSSDSKIGNFSVFHIICSDHPEELTYLLLLLLADVGIFICSSILMNINKSLFEQETPDPTVLICLCYFLYLKSKYLNSCCL